MRLTKLYKKFIQKYIDALTREKSNSIKKQYLEYSNNIGTIFGNIYFHYKDVPKETEYERSIVERAKLKRQRLDDIKEKEKHINNDLFTYYFNYSSPNNMHSRFGNVKGEINENQVYLIKAALTKLKNIAKNVPKDKRFKIEENEKIIYIVKRILELNNENHLGKGLKI